MQRVFVLYDGGRSVNPDRTTIDAAARALEGRGLFLGLLLPLPLINRFSALRLDFFGKLLLINYTRTKPAATAAPTNIPACD